MMLDRLGLPLKPAELKVGEPWAQSDAHSRGLRHKLSGLSALRSNRIS
jgi:hypothetical protein